MNKSKQALWVILGSISTFAFSIVSSMILSRYLDKVDYGTYKQVLYIYNSLAVIFTLGLPKAYSFFIPRVDKNEVKSLIAKIGKVLSLSGVTLSLVLFVGSGVIANALDNPALNQPIRYFSIVPIFLLPTFALNGILASLGRAKLLAIYNVLEKIIMLNFVVIPVIVFDGGTNSAVVGFSLSSIAVFILYTIVLKVSLRDKVEGVRTTLGYKKIFTYTGPIMFASLWGIIFRSTDQFFISRYYGTNIFAEYSNGALELPFITMIIAATSTILAPIYSERAFKGGVDARNEILSLWNSVTSKTVKLTYPMVIFFVFFSHEIMTILYGAQYYSSGDFFRIKLLVNFFTVISFAPLILAIGGQRFYLSTHIYSTIFLILIQFAVVYLTSSPVYIVAATVVVQILMILSMFYYISSYLKVSLIKLFPLRLIIRIIPSIAVLIFIKLIFSYFILIDNLILEVLASGILYLIIYSIWSYFIGINYASLITPLLRSKP